jgi:hypothetical protein
MVYDNYNNPKVRGNTDPTTLNLGRFLPEADYGSIVVITRSAQVKLGPRLRVEKLENIRDSLKILSHTSGRGNTRDNEIYSR